jgi:hypothetical protein
MDGFKLFSGILIIIAPIFMTIIRLKRIDLYGSRERMWPIESYIGEKWTDILLVASSIMLVVIGMLIVFNVI